jgi:ATP-dependent helicase HrpB
LQWGVDDPAELTWLDTPPTGPWQQAVDLLINLGALAKTEGRLTLTNHGLLMVALPVHPRLAHLLVCGAYLGRVDIAILLASILSDRDPFGRENPDITYRLALLSGQSPCPDRHRGWHRRTMQLARQFDEQITRLNIKRDTNIEPLTTDQVTGYLISCAYPDRIARSRHSGGYQLANGRSATLAGNHHLGKSKWLAVAEVGGVARSRGDTIHSATQLDPTLFETLLSDLVSEQTVADWDRKTNRFVAENRKMIGALVLERTKLKSVPVTARQEALINHIREQGLGLLPWSPELRQWQARVMLLRSVDQDESTDEKWPDVSDTALLETLVDWLGPYLGEITQLSHFKKLALKKILSALLPWDKARQLDELAPIRFEVPSGSNISIDYTPSPPVLAVKLQEMFGCEETPTIARGKVPLMVHLLSPAGRPLQVTQDLAGFWRSSYHDVRKELKGRYPKHPWPDDPLTATATRRTTRNKNNRT